MKRFECGVLAWSLLAIASLVMFSITLALHHN
ncbi:hypothetical protein HNQ91_002297 [Filimonas zeae]|nr:hypothetical protein [Filimonas zeae]